MPETLEEVTEKAGELSVTMTEQSNTLVIASHEDLELAGKLLFQAKVQIQIIKTAFAPHKDNAHKAHKDLCKAEQEQLSPFEEVTVILSPKVLGYQVEVQKKEQKEKEEREAQQREAEARTKKEAENLKNERVESLMDEGDFDKAEAIMEAPTHEPMAAYVPEPKKVKVANTGTKKVWKGRVLDFSKVPDKFKMLNQKSVNQYATALKENAKEPGIEFYQDTTLSGK